VHVFYAFFSQTRPNQCTKKQILNENLILGGVFPPSWPAIVHCAVQLSMKRRWITVRRLLAVGFLTTNIFYNIKFTGKYLHNQIALNATDKWRLLKNTMGAPFYYFLSWCRFSSISVFPLTSLYSTTFPYCPSFSFPLQPSCQLGICWSIVIWKHRKQILVWQSMQVE